MKSSHNQAICASKHKCAVNLQGENRESNNYIFLFPSLKYVFSVNSLVWCLHLTCMCQIIHSTITFTEGYTLTDGLHNTLLNSTDILDICNWVCSDIVAFNILLYYISKLYCSSLTLYYRHLRAANHCDEHWRSNYKNSCKHCASWNYKNRYAICSVRCTGKWRILLICNVCLTEFLDIYHCILSWPLDVFDRSADVWLTVFGRDSVKTWEPNIVPSQYPCCP